jgi:hypothetical protein
MAPTVVRSAALDAEKIGRIIGTKAITTPDGVVRVGWARKDVPVKVDGLPMHPFMGLGSWAAFQPVADATVMMGDTVLFEDEVNPAIDAALAANIEITALHNHFFYDEPRVYFMHIGGEGSVDDVAAGVRKVWDAIKEVRRGHPQIARRFPGDVPKIGKLDTDALSKIIGPKGVAEGNVFKITIGRSTAMYTIPLGGSMGITTWAAFAGSEELSVVDGDFAMTSREVPAVLKALRKGGINIVALHNHMMNEEPVIYFTHFWGKGKAQDLAKTLRNALDAQKAANP